MKITNEELRQIIKEELDTLLNEQDEVKRRLSRILKTASSQDFINQDVLSAREFVWANAEDYVTRGIKFNPYMEPLMKMDKESIAKGFNLNPKTGEPLTMKDFKNSTGDKDE